MYLFYPKLAGTNKIPILKHRHISWLKLLFEKKKKTDRGLYFTKNDDFDISNVRDNKNSYYTTTFYSQDTEIEKGPIFRG